jgi:NAD/NADP transhydrogenase alpha subunit
VGTPYEELTVGVPKEALSSENRVGITPANVTMLKKAGFNVNIEAGAGLRSSFTDAAFSEQVCRFDRMILGCA